MALKQGNDSYTKWTHVENGNVMVRRIHRIEIQDRKGRLHVLSAETLPDFIQTSAGVGHKGKHMAQILFGPESVKGRAPDTQPWPTLRDVTNVGMGILLLVMLKFVASLTVSCF